MAWGLIATAVIGGISSYANANAASDTAKDTSALQIKAAHDLAAQKQAYVLQDRQYKENAAGAWAKYADPAMAGPSGFAPAAPSTVVSQPAVTGAPASTAAIDDPNNPIYAAAPIAAASNAIPLQNPGQLANYGKGLVLNTYHRPLTYDPNNPGG